MKLKPLILLIAPPGREARSLEIAFGTNRQRLGRIGVLFPRAGSGLGGLGHDNLAWSLAGCDLFDPHHGGLDEVSREISASGASAVVLSSSALLGLWNRLDVLAALGERFRLIGYDTAALVVDPGFVRYRDGLFGEVSRFMGYPGSREQFDAIVEHKGHFTWRGLCLPGSPDQATAAFAEAFGADAVHRLHGATSADIEPVSEELGRLLGAPDLLVSNRARRDPLNERLEQVVADLDSVINSRSWRVTAPLRKVMASTRHRPSAHEGGDRR
jgi:hypothetical protein